MPRAKYTYHITPSTPRPLNTAQEVADTLGLSVNALRNRFRTGAECVEQNGFTVCRKRVLCTSRYSFWEDKIKAKYGSRRAYDRARKGEQDCD